MNIASKISGPLRLCFAAVLLCGLSACASPDDETVAANLPPNDVQEAPPQQIEIERVPVIQDPQNEIWRPGYWAMIDHQFTWIPGKVMSRPSPTAAWHVAHWVQHAYGWSFEMGHWE